jgi:hypothetical protein
MENMKHAKLILTALTLSIAGAAFAPGSAKALRLQQGGSEDGNGPTRIGNTLHVQEDRIEGLKGINELCTDSMEEFVVYAFNISLKENLNGRKRTRDEMVSDIDNRRVAIENHIKLCQDTVKEAEQSGVARSAIARELVTLFYNVGYNVYAKRVPIQNIQLMTFKNFSVQYQLLRKNLMLPAQTQYEQQGIEVHLVR